MKLGPLGKSLTILAASLVALAAACGTQGDRRNSNARTGNSEPPAREDTPPGMPADARPAGIPGFFMEGPTGAVSLHFVYPKDDTLVEGDSIAPVIQLTGYSTYLDQERK